MTENIFFSPAPIEAVQEFFGLGHETLFTAFSLLGETWGVILAIALTLWIWGKESALEVFVAVIVSVLLKELANVFVSVPRPSGESIVVYQQLETPSFPSGHVLTAVAVWALLAFERRIHWIVAAAAATLVSLGRLYLGAHYLMDVTVAAAAGVLAGWAVWKAWPPLCRKASDLSFAWFAGAGLLTVAVISVNLAMNQGIAHRWSVTGLAIGVVFGLLVDYRWLYDRTPPESSADRSGTRRMLMVAAGLAGIAACYAFGTTIDGSFRYWADLLATLAAATWAFVAVPVLFTHTNFDVKAEAHP